MAKHYILRLNQGSADFLFSLYQVLNVGGPAEKALSDFADTLLDSGGPTVEYEFYLGDHKVEQFELNWALAEKAKQR